MKYSNIQKGIVMQKTVTRRILIVSKPDAECKILHDILKGYGIVDIACSGQRALEKISSHSYDLIVTETSMPLMDGIEFYEEAVNHNRGLKSRFLFFTGSLARYYMKFFAENDLPFIYRPLRAGLLREAVEEILNNTYRT
jgi:CheY-like chemotaxis protein